MIDSSTRQSRVMLITRNLPPLLGGMERLNWHMAEELAKTHDLLIIGPQGCAAMAPRGIKVCEVPLRPLWKFLLSAHWQARKIGKQWHPDLVLAGSGLTAPIAYLVARACNAKAIAYVHGLDIVVRHPVYRGLWLPCLRLLDHAFANSSSTAGLARHAGVARGRITVIHPGTTLAQEHEDPDAAFRARLAPGAGPILLSVGRLTERKGVAEFVLHALPAIVATHPDVRLVIVGDEAPNALRKGTANPVESLRAAIASSGMQNHVVRLGAITDAELAFTYASAAVHVFPVRQVPDDVEGFGMVAIEAAARGLPTVAFAVGGIPDAISDGESGYLVQPGDYAGFAASVHRILAGNSQTMKTSSREFAEGFAWERFGERLRAAISAIATGQRSNPERQGHAILDLGSRAAKARKIDILLGLASAQHLRMLEVGTGSGGIAHYFGTLPDREYEVDAVDVQDTRQIFTGYRFTRVTGTDLPFPDAHFDVVISNHVIEHVGDDDAQVRHIAELRRVLRPQGVVYLAMPNRWMLVEPHYRLAFLSWWPERWRSGWLRLWKKGETYDCRPLSRGDLEGKLASAGFRLQQLHGEAMRAFFETEQPNARIWLWLLRHIPDRVYAWGRGMFPTLIYRLWRA